MLKYTYGKCPQMGSQETMKTKNKVSKQPEIKQ